jgi:glutamine amidotransferase
MIAIVDYGVGNLFSLARSFAAIGVEVEITADPEKLRSADKILLPGVGAFGDAAEKLRQSGLDRVVTEQAATGKPLMGICLGMQLLFEEGHEYGIHKGLGLIPGKVVAMAGVIPENLKIPHMGWNNLKTRDCPLFDVGDDPCVYFVHSYCMADVSEEWTAATCTYGQIFTAAICKGNVMATQFHPEKSGEAGLRMLKRFAEWKGAASC